jgi:hypothetical protein
LDSLQAVGMCIDQLLVFLEVFADEGVPREGVWVLVLIYT